MLDNLRQPTNCTELANASFWDGCRLQPAESIMLAGSQILSERAARATNLRKYDCSGLFVLPGLIDMHVHVTMDPERTLQDPISGATSCNLIGDTIARNLNEALSAGITTLRDVGARRSFNPTIDSLKLPSYPRIVRAGQMITAVGGHGAEPAFKMGAEVASASEAVEAVRQEVAEGAELIKLVTCGASTQNEFTVEELISAVKEAHQLGLRVACHAHFKRNSIKNALDANVDTLEHGCVLDPELIAQMLAQGTYYCPTLAVIEAALDHPDQYGGKDSSFYQMLLEIVAKHRSSFTQARERDVKIIAGTDAGLPMVKFSALHDEFEAMLRLGMTPAGVIKAATSVAAEALGLGDSLGKILPGFAADLIFVDKNPLDNIQALRHPLAVMRSGEIVYGSLPMASEAK